ncbi:hypothetical protein LINGRAHAP2_LOCUS14684, partial [Linum grandiflorum]
SVSSLSTSSSSSPIQTPLLQSLFPSPQSLCFCSHDLRRRRKQRFSSFALFASPPNWNKTDGGRDYGFDGDRK